MDIKSPNHFRRLPSAVLFDLDDTLYAYEPAHRQGIAAARHKAQKLTSIGEAEFDRLYEQARAEVKSRLAGTGSAHNRLLYFQRLIELAGFPSQPLFALELDQTYWRSFLGGAQLLPGVLDVLAALRRLGVSLALVTDLTAQIQFRKLIYFGLDNHFDCVVTSEEAGRDKPDPLIFRLACERLHVTGRTVWMIGDSQADLQGAKEAVQAVTLLRRGSSAYSRELAATADAVFDDFPRLVAFLGALKAVPSSA